MFRVQVYTARFTGSQSIFGFKFTYVVPKPLTPTICPTRGFWRISASRAWLESLDAIIRVRVPRTITTVFISKSILLGKHLTYLLITFPYYYISALKPRDDNRTKIENNIGIMASSDRVLQCPPITIHWSADSKRTNVAQRNGIFVWARFFFLFSSKRNMYK